jgi:hypothetical protein
MVEAATVGICGKCQLKMKDMDMAENLLAKDTEWR